MKFCLLLISLTVVTLGSSKNSSSSNRNGKLLSLFQIVQFPNDPCVSTSRNGTCYTSDECESRGGSSSGSCAQGFGVCCIFSLACGSSISENCTYLVQTGVTSVSPNPCTYSVCKCSTQICRIRFDFTIFDIAPPVLGEVMDPPVANRGGAIGDCTSDTFSLTSPGGSGSPIICGINTGQHLIVDASDNCNVAAFNLGGSGSSTRSWDIKVTQYTCASGLGGPPGCLQYLTGASGTISSFNFPIANAVIGPTVTHLSDQHYTICMRQEASRCAICYTPRIQSIAPMIAAQSSFGVSKDPAAGALMSAAGVDCSEDYVLIPGAENNPAMGAIPTAAGALCGRAFSVFGGRRCHYL
ncbi:uncharacterized protein LOC131890277 [Tigriopus californicus]|uniref:uncharacterized protein LOC131890277 n=1 Tax=Tigriopus californicus TaxID=6832 RepID=UPI0027DA4A6A|nr:uncharacterized protein LOC131890277 [Tigriopus californicus]